MSSNDALYFHLKVDCGGSRKKGVGVSVRAGGGLRRSSTSNRCRMSNVDVIVLIPATNNNYYSMLEGGTDGMVLILTVRVATSTARLHCELIMSYFPSR